MSEFLSEEGDEPPPDYRKNFDELIRQWKKYVRDTWPGSSGEIFKNPTKEFILDQRKRMAELGVECTPKEVAALIKLIYDALEE
jgi:hypothetical protein